MGKAKLLVAFQKLIKTQNRFLLCSENVTLEEAKPYFQTCAVIAVFLSNFANLAEEHENFRYNNGSKVFGKEVENTDFGASKRKM